MPDRIRMARKVAGRGGGFKRGMNKTGFHLWSECYKLRVRRGRCSGHAGLASAGGARGTCVLLTRC